MAKYVIAPFLEEGFAITQVYGDRVDYYRQVSGGQLQNGHEGIDYGTPVGTPIKAPFDGVILREGLNVGGKDYGNIIVIADPIQHIAMWFAHLSDIKVIPGQSVVKGNIMGLTGNTGNVQPRPTPEQPHNGAHLHVNLCETDANFSRLNQGNGSLGFLNLLDSNLVQIGAVSQATAQSATPTETQTGATNPEYVKALEQDRTRFWQEADAEKAQLAIEEQKLADSDKALADLRTQNQELGQQLEEANKLLIGYKARGYTSVEDVDAVLKQKDAINQGLQAQISQTLKRNKDLATVISDKEHEDATAIDLGTQAQKDLEILRSDLTTIAKAHGSAPTLFSILGSLDQLFNIKAHYEKLMEKLSKEKVTKEEIDTVVTEGEKLVTSKQINKLFGL